MTVDKANWQITANSFNTTYNGQANLLNGTFAFDDGSGYFVQFQDSPGVASPVNSYLPVTYSVIKVGPTVLSSSNLGVQTSLTNAGQYVVKPSVFRHGHGVGWDAARQ